MHDTKMYCLSLYDNTLSTIKRMGYLPVGLGSNNFSNPNLISILLKFSFISGGRWKQVEAKTESPYTRRNFL